MSNYVPFPSQKKSLSQKGDKWRKACIDGAEGLAIFRDEGLRKSYKNKRINYDLYADILDENDMVKMVDPLGLENNYTPGKAQNYPIINPKLDLLWGEETKKRFEWRLRTINDDAISDKEKALNEELGQLLAEEVQKQAIDEEDLQRRLAEFEKYRSYEYQDKREQMGTWILKHLWEEQNIKMKLDKGFKDALISGEEVFQWDIIAGQPVLLKHNPLHVHTVRSGNSPYIEESEIIVIDSYYAPGKVIDEYHEFLSGEDISYIEERSLQSSGGGGSDTPDMMMDRTHSEEFSIDTSIFEAGITDYSTPFDSDGNVRVLKVYWKSMRKMIQVKYYDAQGDEQYELMPEGYVIDKEAGEEGKTIWISEWWEGHKIACGYSYKEGDGIYVKMQPRPIQFRRMENPSICHPGIVGTVFNTNDNVAMSLMDRMKPYQYMYNMLMYNVELLIATNWGKIMKLDVTQVPDGWEVDKWISYAKYIKIAPVDPFKEGKKGAALGKIAGNLQSSSANPVIDMTQGDTIQLYINMMEHIKREVGEIVGISRAREGQISPSSTSGNVQREVIQSSHQTEYWFAEHADLKRRVLAAGLETAKLAWAKSGTKKMQFVLDDMATKMVSITAEDLVGIDFDLHVSNSRDDQELMDNLKQLAHAGIQNDKVTFSQLMDIYTSDSLSVIRRKMENAEMDKAKRDRDAAQQAERIEQARIEAAAKEKELERAHDIAMEDKKHSNAITIESLKAQLKGIDRGLDLDHDGVKDEVEIKKTLMQNQAEAQENEKQRNFEATEAEKERQNKLELERIKARKKNTN